MSKIHQLSSRVDELEEQIGTSGESDSNWIREGLDELQSQISTLKSRCTKLENRVRELEE